MKKTLEKLKPLIYEQFDYLHQYPEVSWKEKHTTDYIADVLRKNGCRVTTFQDCTGVVGEWGNGDADSPAIGVRADMDALWQEVNDAFQANHSCGHDAHMTMILGVLLLLKEEGIQLPGRLKFIFQPAEEVGEGALKMIEKGIIDDVDFLYGVHLRPIQELSAGHASPAIIHGAAETISGRIKGFDVHGARPHLGPNAIEVMAIILDLIKGIRLDPLIPYSVKMTQINAGGKTKNIIPGSGQFHLDLRAQTNEAMDKLIMKVEAILNQVAALYGVDISFEHQERVYAAVVNAEARQMMANAVTKALGEGQLTAPIVTPGAEDFHFYTKERPDVKATMLGLGCDLQPGLHHPQMSFNRDALLDGVEILTRAVIETFNTYV
ncbi:amidohydrolase [Scopulibacillus darangshiensis]|uniref:Amidohydrolase n=1 Tax=Scopulibacillus darangshiensis TaxID=442528 RepID=A0A4R2NI54_9BACL|nr:M20 peptidase aminoacylase family protein [Scopulibacillus darangshiensis]TCP21169.1 amidohydrolase [Scopulibacillus darangshiensis]